MPAGFTGPAVLVLRAVSFLPTRVLHASKSPLPELCSLMNADVHNGLCIGVSLNIPTLQYTFAKIVQCLGSIPFICSFLRTVGLTHGLAMPIQSAFQSVGAFLMYHRYWFDENEVRNSG